jgi:hypothetical protein
LQGEFVLSTTKEFLPEDAWLPAPLPACRVYRPEGRAYRSESRTAISATAVIVS